MTLVLSLACPDYVMHVSDRLLTMSDDGREFDPIANKSIVHLARNGVAAMGYSGIAHIREIPTDEWIAQCLTSQGYEENDKRRGICFGRNASGTTLDRAFHRLRTGLSSVPEPKEFGLTVCVAGWKIINRRIFPFYNEFIWRRGAARADICTTPRPWFWRSSLCLGNIGKDAGKELSRLFEAYRRKNPHRLTPTDAEAVLLECLREVAARDSTVGSHALVITLPHPALGPGSSRFVPALPHLARIVGRDNERTIPVAHSPWVIWGDLVYAPSALAGDFILTSGGYEFQLRGASVQDGVPGLSSSIRRPGPP